ncbi:hypothetical protein QTI24_21350 [Variovorax sp. J22P240]|uniref:hypothetical protein n=1 Tax=unclassified Variovorax TaxID=663243 RepID=UPI002577586F|nr:MULTISPECIES: hypothetical protein [unclassified Variovorax]MDM0001168.1 hypothetical protein [Variovorax sp. J22P240]MDM0049747.1 hypothetical protein [Variovorax sp. J22R115]
MTVVDEALLERVARERRFDPRTLEIARRLFLGNDSAKMLSTEYGVIHQRIYAIRRMVQEAVQSYGLPDGWSEVTLSGPADLVRAAKARFERQKRARLRSEQ